jgi:hypothetical protein
MMVNSKQLNTHQKVSTKALKEPPGMAFFGAKEKGFPKMETNMKENLRMTSRMEMEHKHGQMETNMKEIIRMI